MKALFPRVALALFVSSLAAPDVVSAIIIRHDREDARYLELAKTYSQVVRMQAPGEIPDGVGTLVAPQWVVTAAHIATLLEPGHIVKVAGRDFEIAAIFIHPSWNDGPHDIALVRLESEVPESHPALLYRKRDEIGQLITVVGDGDKGDGRTGPVGNDGRMRAATNRIDEASDFWLKFVFRDGPRATDLEGISGPGDSGGPAFVEHRGDLYVVGVGSGQSTRATQGREGLYGVTEYYTRVSSYLKWLDDTMRSPGAQGAAPPVQETP
ncbi:MAG: trypsin-like serine protease [Acidobacteriota bacterium]